MHVHIVDLEDSVCRGVTVLDNEHKPDPLLRNFPVLHGSCLSSHLQARLHFICSNVHGRGIIFTI